MKIKKTILVTEDRKGSVTSMGQQLAEVTGGGEELALTDWAHRTATPAIAQETVGLWVSRNTMGILTSRHFVNIWKGTS